MTGASRGIGRVAARRLVREGSRAHLVLLNRGDSPDLVEELRAYGGAVSVVRTDLSRLRSVADAAAAVAERVREGMLPPIRTLVCNAGVQHTNALTETADGFESTFAVNVLANHVLVRGLQRHLHPRARVVLTVSDTHVGDLRHNLGMVPGPRWQPVQTLARHVTGQGRASPRRRSSGRDGGSEWLVHRP
ncbi:SDR family NAD(P)-dependent oxidoreductase [Salana multivorans]